MNLPLFLSVSAFIYIYIWLIGVGIEFGLNEKGLFRSSCSVALFFMEIVTVNRWLLQLSVVDEQESEAVAISCVEFLLSEANAYYQQCCLTRKAVRAVSSRLRDNVLDTAFAAALDAEQALDTARFEQENRPEAESKDRHAVRSVPSRSSEKPILSVHTLMTKISSSPASRVGSSPEKSRSRLVGVSTRRRRKVDKGNFSPKTSWVGVIAAPPINIVAALAATPVRMKTNVDSFSAILNAEDTKEESKDPPIVVEDTTDPVTTRRSRRPSDVLESTGRILQPMSTAIHSIAENPQRQPKRRSQSASVDSTIQQQRKTTQLADSLSRRKLTRKPSSSESLYGSTSNNGWSSSRSLWRYEQDPGSSTSRTFVSDGTEFNATTLPATMNVVSGVVLLQGESVIEGPEWIENATTMSRKRFDVSSTTAFAKFSDSCYVMINSCVFISSSSD
ncbi:unnamed protein product [Phytophthora fragariaefolia]|uniref:Unnamed protein product n=1 Tax=Phytophthora fragariaefolia TaxID=1490495 RepID=A0A9W6XMS9_9STRA|nr:unnamed protein product [Phytophthora fragariaefolia]